MPAQITAAPPLQGSMWHHIRAMIGAGLTLALCCGFGAVYATTFLKLFGFHNFPDLENYRIFFEAGYYYQILINKSLIELLISESGWTYIGDLIISDRFDVYDFLLISSAISFGLSAYFIYKYTKNLLYILMLINPISMDLYVGQNRSALASSVFLFSLTLDRLSVRIFTMFVAFTIHLSTSIFIGSYVAYEFITKFFRKDNVAIRISTLVISATLIALFTTLLRSYTLSQIGDSRADDLIISISSWTFVWFWSSTLIMLIALTDKNELSFEHYLSLIFVLCFFFYTYIEAFGSRWMAFAIPFIVVGASKLPSERKLIYIFYFVLVSIVAYAYWISQARFY